MAPGWPDDPDSVAEGRANPDAFAGKGVAEITDHFGEAARQLTRPPAIIGHSFGGLITQKLAGEGLAAAAVAIDPAQMRGVLALPLSTLKASFPVLRNPANKSKAVMLTYEQWRYAFANAVDEDEAKALYEQYPVPGAGRPLFQAAFANFNPKAETAVDTYQRHARAAADHLRRGRSHRAQGGRPRCVQALRQVDGDHRVRRDVRPRALAGPRQRVA